MNVKQIVAYISNMRSRDELSTIINTAEARDSRLSSIEGEERRKRAWSKVSHIRKGSIVFAHKKPEGKYAVLYGVGLKVLQVKPRAKEILVCTIQGERKTCTLTALMCDTFKISEEPTVAAFDNALVGDAPIERKVK